jgi:predicted membrane-bound spermidine synthase
MFCSSLASWILSEWELLLLSKLGIIRMCKLLNGLTNVLLAYLALIQFSLIVLEIKKELKTNIKRI